MKFVLIIFLSFSVMFSFSQAKKISNETFVAFGKKINTLFLIENFKTNDGLSRDSLLIEPIEKSNAIFEMRCYWPQIGLNSNDNLVVGYRLISSKKASIFLSNSIKSKYRLKDNYPDSINIDDRGLILQQNKISLDLDDSTALKLLTELIDFYVAEIDDQKDYFENDLSNDISVYHPCKNKTDCFDYYLVYHLKINNQVKKVYRIGLDYYDKNKQLIRLKNNFGLYKLFWKMADLLVMSKY